MEVKAKPANGGKRTSETGGRPILVEKELEKKRRQHMKELCEKLASLIPKEHFPHADTMTQLGSLDVAASYIKKLKERVDQLQHKKTSIQAVSTLLGVSGISTPIITATMSGGVGSPEGGKKLEASPLVVEVREPGDASMEVRLICSIGKPIKLHEVITILEEEGAVIINANHYVAADRIFYTIHSWAFSTRIGIDVSRISERLGALV
ncbi:transcription factor bHLH168-like [Triticum dicoccoides]|uniref:transcription factor bHLH168-like n=1 Tax=Triticum dicoccoides TaxID=85692 RepID=UPI001890891F|nr:transcription factor bHLH168-like [Triticum dicoccoides]XP_044338161.1 transcription factor bHLH168-like [Triticum aestivum]